MTHPVEKKVSSLNAPATLEHGVPGYLASDEALIHLLNRYPAELFDINHYAFDADGQVSLETGERGHADGATVLKAIKTGKLWVNLRDIEHAHPGLWAEIQMSFDKLGPQIGVKKARKMTGQLILSSPATRVPYHFDAAGVVLFHLRGVKRVWVYPATEDFLPQEAMEQVIMRTTTEELPYQRIMDGAAWRFDVVPGEALAWPLYAPHRVENQEGLCVSLSMDYQTWGSRITTGAHRANGVLRRWGHKIQPMQTTPWVKRAALWATSLVFQRLGLVKNNIKDFKRSFDVADGSTAEVAPTPARFRSAA
jgi:hypothetical protein